MSLKLMLSAGGMLIVLALFFLTNDKYEHGSQEAVKNNSQLLDINNSPINFPRFKGKVVFVNNWASWCPPCVAEMSSIQALKSELDERDFEFVMISYDEDHDKAVSFMKRKGYNLKVSFPGDRYPYATESIPSTFILDREGKVVLKEIGMKDYSKKEIVDFMKSIARK